MLDLVTRAEWGAAPPKRPPYRIKTPTAKLYLHHAAGAIIPGDDTVSPDDLRRVHSIQEYHQHNRGWNDIAYSYLTDPDGYLFEGRGAGIAGGHTAGQNTVSHAICVMGNYDTQPVDTDLLDRLALIVVWGHALHYWPLGFTGGHRDAPGAATSCPGRNLHPLLPVINQRAKDLNMARFKDVPTTHPHYKSIEWLAANGITAGANPPKNDLYEPFRQVRRDEFATFLKRYHERLGK